MKAAAEVVPQGLVPRGGEPGERSLIAAAAAVVLVVAGPFAVAAGFAALVAVFGQVRVGWRPVAVAGAALAGVVLAVAWLAGTGPQAALLAVVVAGRGSVLLMAAAGIPAGVACGAGAVGAAHRRAAGVGWHPAQQHRQVAVAAAGDRQAAWLRRPEQVRRCAAEPLGVYRGGDLRAWMRGRYVVPPDERKPATGIVGESGSGKTVTVERFVWLWAAAGFRLIFADFKGSDPELPERVAAAVIAARGGSGTRVTFWPWQPLDIWLGSEQEIANRLLQVQDFSEPFYRQAAETAVRLAVSAPGVAPPSDSADFLRRLDAKWLERAYEGIPASMQDVNAIKMPQVMEGVRLRYGGFFAALGGRLDHGRSWDDADLTVLTIPTLVQPSDAMASARTLLADFGAYALSRKPRGEKVAIVIDEYSAVTGAARQVIDLAERVRDAGGRVVVCAQNYEGLGRNPDERQRMRDALLPGGLVVHRMGHPDQLLEVAAGSRVPDRSWHLDEDGPTGRVTVREQREPGVDPDDVRRLPVGEAYIITGGRQLRMNVIRNEIPPAAAEAARGMAAAAREAAESSAAEAALQARQSRWPEPGRDAGGKPVRRRAGREAAQGAGLFDEGLKPWN